MKLEKAIAEDIELSITAQEADKQFAEGSIKSKFNFQCPDENCYAQVTCANLDRPKAKRKRNPYYKVVGEHSPKCNIAKDIDPQKKSSRITTDIYSDSDEYVDHAIRLNLQPPSTKRPEPTGNAPGDDDTDPRARAGHNPESGKRKIQLSKTLSSLFDVFLTKESHLVHLPEDVVIDIKDLFVEINGQDLAELKDEFRIYYGKAWFNKNERYYSIAFANTLTSGDLTKRPTIYLPLEEEVAKSGFKRFKLKELEKAADGKPRMVFLLSKKRPRVKENKYINIRCKVPEYLDYRL